MYSSVRGIITVVQQITGPLFSFRENTYRKIEVLWSDISRDKTQYELASKYNVDDLWEKASVEVFNSLISDYGHDRTSTSRRVVNAIVKESYVSNRS